MTANSKGAPRPFDLNQCIMIYGALRLEEFGGDDAITIEPQGTDFVTVIGCDGSVNRNKNNSNFYMITVNLSQGSPANQELSLLHQADLLTNETVEFAYIDKNGTTVFTSIYTWITKPANIEAGKDPKTRVWTFQTGAASTCVYNVGQVNL